MSDHTTHNKTGAREVFLRTIAIVGLLAVLVLGAWGIILLAFNLPSVFSNVGSSISAVFNAEDTEPVDETPVTTIPTQPTTPTTPVKPTTPTTPSNNNTYTYVPAAVQATQLYGYGDLAVTISSVQPTNQYYGQTQNTRRYTMQFTVSNVGTNVVQSGWNFNTLIPWTPNTYTFTSQAQQALYPGDKIVYTLGFDAYVDGTVCTMQYPNNCGQYQNPNYNYNNQNVTCGYRYNGYSNVYACGYTDVNGNWIDMGTNYNQNYNQNQYTYPYNYNRTVTVNADPSNWTPELNENNNRATIQLSY